MLLYVYKMTGVIDGCMWMLLCQEVCNKCMVMYDGYLSATTTNLVTIGLWGQFLVQRSHLSCQMLESIPEFSLLTRKDMNHRKEQNTDPQSSNGSKSDLFIISTVIFMFNSIKQVAFM